MGVVPAATEDHAEAFEILRENQDVISEVDGYREHMDRVPDYELTLTLRIGELPLTIKQMMQLDTLYFAPVEWNDAMPMMNYVATSQEVEWVLRMRLRHVPQMVRHACMPEEREAVLAHRVVTVLLKTLVVGGNTRISMAQARAETSHVLRAEGGGRGGERAGDVEAHKVEEHVVDATGASLADVAA